MEKNSAEEQRPLYRLKELRDNPKKPILIVEGEKTADATAKLFPHHAVISWSEGAQSFSKTDWTHLKDRDVVIWPDNDTPGHNTAGPSQSS